MRARRFLIRAGILITGLWMCVLAIPQAGSADPLGPDCSDTADSCEVGVEVPGNDGGSGTDFGEWGEEAPSAGGGVDPGPFADCSFTVVETDAKTHAIAGDRPKGDYELVVETCTSAAGETIKRAEWVAAGADGQVLIDPALLAQQAVDRLTLPRPGIAASPESVQLVNLPTWLAVTEASWEAQTAEASLGSQVATATATPVQAVWDMGDGHVVTCADRGEEWDPGTDPETEGPCGHTYTQPSAEELDVQVDITWHITWEVVWPGESVSGTSPDMTTTEVESWPVIESQSLNQQ
ncbi:hypothetical protein LO763_11570 [Glycomyces sp. A-F 0318]|uniref:hypothetical protein n=1 Tax=Glycomyces amatae TaxID=2881355 RepID=UPI001E3955C6|nr:hypothetical protein [Glycomyces amatae]MCD0444260.1 hypothetical protein [Glycomyces amatae]